MATRLKNDVPDLQALLRGHALGIDVGYAHALASRSLDAGGGGKREAEAAKRFIVLAHARIYARLLVVRQRAELYRRGFLRSIVPIDQIGLFPRAEGRHPAREVARTVDPLAVEAEDHIARFKSGRACRRIRLGFHDESAFGGFQAETIGDFLGHRLNLDANPTPRDHAFVFQRRDDGLRGLGGNGKTNADTSAPGRENRRIDADHLTLGIESGTARIAPVDRRIDLQEVIVGPGANVAPARRNDTGRNRSPQSEGIADRDHPVAHPWRGGGEVHRLVGTALLDFQESEIGFLVGSDDGCRHGFAVVQGHGDLGGVLDDVVVRDNIAIGGDNEPRALRVGEVRLEVMTRRRSFLAEMFKEALEWIARRNMRYFELVAG